MLVEAPEVQPLSLVTVYEYVPEFKSGIVVLTPFPDVFTPPGVLVSVHVPDEGNAFKTILPVAVAQVGWEIFPGEGAVGMAGALIITKSADDTHVGLTVLRALIV